MLNSPFNKGSLFWTSCLHKIQMKLLVTKGSVTVCRCARVCVCAGVHMCARVCVCAQVCARVHMCTRVHVCVCASSLLLCPSQQGVRTALLCLRSVPHTPNPDLWPPAEGKVAPLFRVTPDTRAQCSGRVVACFLVGCLCSSGCWEVSAAPVFQPGSCHVGNLGHCQLCPGST